MFSFPARSTHCLMILRTWFGLLKCKADGDGWVGYSGFPDLWVSCFIIIKRSPPLYSFLCRPCISWVICSRSISCGGWSKAIRLNELPDFRQQCKLHLISCGQFIKVMFANVGACDVGRFRNQSQVVQSLEGRNCFGDLRALSHDTERN